ncbi:MAG: dockerin type I domain-containing protein [Candidatus Poribacteria bacterium]
MPAFFNGKISLSNTPLVGQKAYAKLDLYAVADNCLNAVIKFRIPEGVSIIGNDTFNEYSIIKGSVSQYSVEIQVLQEGTYAIQASVYFQLADGRYLSEHFFTYLTVEKSYSKTSDRANFLTPAKHSIEANIRSYLAPPNTQLLPQGNFKLYGNIKYYNDNLSQEMPIKMATVQLYELISDKRKLIATKIAGDDGSYVFDDIVFGNIQETHDIQLKILFDNDILRLIDNNEKIYEFDAPIIKNVSVGALNCDYYMNESNQYRGLAHIFNTYVDAYDFLQNRLGWGRKKIDVKYPYQNEVSNYGYSYRPFKGGIYDECINIVVSKQWERSSMLHEYGHSVMSALYDYNYYKLPRKTVNLYVHYINSISDLGFAMREGWAEFFEVLVDDNAFNLTQYINANTPNIEYNSWWKGKEENNTKGEIVEGSIASIFWDIVDTNKSIDEKMDIDDDNMSADLTKLWEIMSKHKPNDIVAFWDYWIGNSYGQVTELYSIYMNNGVKVYHPYDINGDGRLDYYDLESLASDFGKKATGSAQVNHDVNKDGIVNIIDFIIISKEMMLK